MTREEEGAAKHGDRKLGDEWIGWKGEGDPSDLEVDESLSTFVLLASANLLLFIALLNAGWYLVRPRVEQFVPYAPMLVGWAVAGFGACLVLIVVLETVLVLKCEKTPSALSLCGKVPPFPPPHDAFGLGASSGSAETGSGTPLSRPTILS